MVHTLYKIHNLKYRLTFLKKLKQKDVLSSNILLYYGQSPQFYPSSKKNENKKTGVGEIKGEGVTERGQEGRKCRCHQRDEKLELTSITNLNLK